MPVGRAAPNAVLAFGALLSLLAVTAASAADPPPNVGKTVVIDGKPMATNGKIVSIDGDQVLFDGRPAMIDGKPLVTGGHTILLDGKPVVQNGKVMNNPVLLVFTIDTLSQSSSPYRLERDVSTPIERAVKTVPGVIEAHSTAVGHRAQTRLFFAPSTDPVSTLSLIRLRVEQIRMRLPHDASKPLIAWRRETADGLQSGAN